MTNSKNLSNRLFFKEKRKSGTLYKLRIDGVNYRVKTRNPKQFEEDIK